MMNATTLVRQGKRAQIWHEYCGFLDLSVPEFLAQQEVGHVKMVQDIISILGRYISQD